MNERNRARADQRLGQDRNRRARPRAARDGHRDSLHRRHRESDSGGRGTGGGCLLVHRVPGGDGRPRQDPAPEDSRRPARAARCRLRDDARARHRGNRPAGRQPLSVRADGCEAGLRPRDSDREHRHRRTGDAAGGGQEPCMGDRRRRCGRLRRGARGASRGQSGHAGHAVPSRGQGVRAHCTLRRRDRRLPRRTGRHGCARRPRSPAP